MIKVSKTGGRFQQSTCHEEWGKKNDKEDSNNTFDGYIGIECIGTFSIC